MSAEDNKGVIRRLIEEVCNKGNLEIVDELMAPDVFDHAAVPRTPARPRWVQARHRVGTQHQLRRALRLRRHHRPRRQGAVRMTQSGTHTGTLREGRPPTGKRFSVDYVHWFRLAHGMVAELYGP
jgi:ketosteroid isomerase-like protein